VLSILWLVSVATGAAWNLAPHPLRGWWLASAIACVISGTAGTVIAVFWAITYWRRTGQIWPRSSGPTANE
jgi:hypothetical protein